MYTPTNCDPATRFCPSGFHATHSVLSFVGYCPVRCLVWRFHSTMIPPYDTMVSVSPSGAHVRLRGSAQSGTVSNSAVWGFQTRTLVLVPIARKSPLGFHLMCFTGEPTFVVCRPMFVSVHHTFTLPRDVPAARAVPSGFHAAQYTQDSSKRDVIRRPNARSQMRMPASPCVTNFVPSGLWANTQVGSFAHTVHTSLPVTASIRSTLHVLGVPVAPQRSARCFASGLSTILRT